MLDEKEIDDFPSLVEKYGSRTRTTPKEHIWCTRGDAYKEILSHTRNFLVEKARWRVVGDDAAHISGRCVMVASLLGGWMLKVLSLYWVVKLIKEVGRLMAGQRMNRRREGQKNEEEEDGELAIRLNERTLSIP